MSIPRDASWSWPLHPVQRRTHDKYRAYRPHSCQTVDPSLDESTDPASRHLSPG